MTKAIMKKLIVGNWKENPRTAREALALFSDIARARRGSAAQVVVCPPFIYLEEISKKFRRLRSASHLSLGAQDVFGRIRARIRERSVRRCSRRLALNM